MSREISEKSSQARNSLRSCWFAIQCWARSSSRTATIACARSIPTTKTRQFHARSYRLSETIRRKAGRQEKSRIQFPVFLPSLWLTSCLTLRRPASHLVLTLCATFRHDTGLPSLPMEWHMAKKQRSRVADCLMYLTVRLLVCVLQAVPFEAACRFADLLAWIIYKVDKR